jgi:hypothetical protein
MKKVITITILFSIVVILTSSFISFSDKLMFFNPKINKDSLLNSGIPERIVNQYVKVRQSFKYMGKSFFIVDTRENLIYFFDENGKFFAKSPTIDGQDRQSTNPQKISEALNSWGKHALDAGFKFDKKSKKYVDITGKNRRYSHSYVFKVISSNKRRFFPKGVYEVHCRAKHSNFVGKGENAYYIKTSKGKILTVAIHSLYNQQYRKNIMNVMQNQIGSDFKNPKVSKSFQKMILNNINNSTFNNSFGCINVPFEFIKITKEKAIGSLVFVLGESETDYTL